MTFDLALCFCLWVWSSAAPTLPQDVLQSPSFQIIQCGSVPFVLVLFVLTLHIPVESRSQADRGKVWGSSLLACPGRGRSCLQEACCRGDVKHTSSCLTSVSSEPRRPAFLPSTPPPAHPLLLNPQPRASQSPRLPSHFISQVCRFNCSVTPSSPPFLETKKILMTCLSLTLCPEQRNLKR